MALTAIRRRSLAEAEAALRIEGLAFSNEAKPLLNEWLAGRISSDALDRKLVDLAHSKSPSVSNEPAYALAR